MNWFEFIMSDGTWCFTLYEDKPTDRRSTISRMVRSSINLNLSLTKSALLFDWDEYSRIPKVAPCGPPPIFFLRFFDMTIPFDWHVSILKTSFGHYLGKADSINQIGNNCKTFLFLTFLSRAVMIWCNLHTR